MFKWMRECVELRRIERQLERTNALYAKALRDAADEGQDWQDRAALNLEARHETGLVYSQINAIKTARLLRRAARYSVPLSAREEGEDWEWDTSLGRWLLTEHGAMKLRREIAVEVENDQKPWMNRASIAISLVSLLVAIVALFSE